MDNFSAHITGIELHPPPSNIRIEWLPPNSTSRTQPLDQGIIQNFKVYYRQQQLLIMLSCFDMEEDDTATHENTILQEVIQEHLGLISTEEEEEEWEELEQPLPTLQEARHALQVLVEKSYSRALERLTTDIKYSAASMISLVISSRQQSTLDSWII